MRIIAGEFRGRRLLPPKTDATRPITDRVKQSLFDILTPYISGATVYDCFAGTGSLGLESISRGAERAVLFEMDRSAASILRRNVDALRVADRCTIIPGDLFTYFWSRPSESAPPASLIFLDPPYQMVRTRQDDLRKLAQKWAGRHTTPEGIIVFRHATEDALDLPPLQRYDERTYGGMTIELLKKP